MSLPPDNQDTTRLASLGQAFAGFFDAAWYMSRYPDVAAAGVDPLRHFLTRGAQERRDPNRWFDSAWYAEHYPDIGPRGLNPLLHYLQSGAEELRNPHPRFDAAWYADQHPESAGNPLLYHLRIGAARGWPTERLIEIDDHLPATGAPATLRPGVFVDVIIPVYRGLAQTRRCIRSVLADTDRPPGRVIVIDDRSPEPLLAAWLDKLAQQDSIILIRHRRNLGFVASVNRGMTEAGDHDVVLLNSDTEVPAGWLTRLAAQAYAAPRIASVSPFSNNATICGYPSDVGGPILFGLPLIQVDDTCRIVNKGRSVDVPTTVGFCMYIRRDALRDVGLFDTKAFGKGYGEENDFCMRASGRGWQHRVACDVFVYHQGSASFGADGTALADKGLKLISARYPGYKRIIDQHVRRDEIGPSRFAVTCALFRASRRPTILMVSHDLGGGVQRHIGWLTARLRGHANVLLLHATTRGSTLSVPALAGHPSLTLPGERINDLIRLLRSAAVSRIHLHHLAGVDMDIRTLIHRLDVPFDVTVHDYFAICPQVNLLPWPNGQYCAEPGPATCNACIAERPSHGARDVLSWRHEHAWQFLEADRVLCPSNDVKERLARYGLDSRAVLAPHEAVASGPWPVSIPTPTRGPLRIAVLGVLAPHKGAHTVAALAEAADPGSIEVHLIGDVEADFPQHAAAHLRITGKYADKDLPALLARTKPHVVWFPASWPETFSYTLSAAIAAGLPIVAVRIGAFPERLKGRAYTWLAEPTSSTAAWLRVFAEVRAALRNARPIAAKKRHAVADFYAKDYLAVQQTTGSLLPRPMRRAGRTSMVVVPERLDNGVLSPCAYIRLLQPLDHPQIGGDIDVVIADAETALDYDADVIVTQRYALSDMQAADALAVHARRTGATLVYDMDDDLLNIPRRHPDAAALRPKARIVQRILRHADAVCVSTPALAAGLMPLRRDIVVVPNGIDERLWQHPAPVSPPFREGSLRILCMGTATHDDDFAIVAPALTRLRDDFGDSVTIDMLGFSSRGDLPPWINRLSTPPLAALSYPGFVSWITSQPGWDVGLAPLADTPFNRCKSPIKTLDYAALGLAVLASDIDVYRGSLADGPGGILVPNDTASWYTALSWLLRNTALRRRLAQGAHDALAATGTLAAQAESRRRTWQRLLRQTKAGPGSNRAPPRAAVNADVAYSD